MFFYKKIYISVAACLLFANTASAEVVSLDLGRSLKMGFAVSEDLDIAENNLGQSKDSYVLTRSEMMPQINAGINYTNNMEYPQTAELNDYDLDNSISLNQLLFSFGRVTKSIKKAKEGMSVAEISSLKAEAEVEYRIKDAYYSALLASQIMDAYRKSLDNARENKKILKERSLSGRSSKADNIKIEADISARIPFLRSAEGKFVSAKNYLCMLLGLPSGSKIDFTEGFNTNYPLLDKREIVNAFYKSNPDIAILTKREKMESLEVAKKQAEFLPQVYLYGKYNYKGSGSDYDIGRDNIDNYWTAGVKVEIPIWTGGRNTASYNIAKKSLSNISLELQKTKKELLVLLENAVSEYNLLRDELSANEQSLKLAGKNFTMMQDFFASGQISSTDLNDAENHFTQQQIRLEQTLYSINVKKAFIEKLILRKI